MATQQGFWPRAARTGKGRTRARRAHLPRRPTSRCRPISAGWVKIAVGCLPSWRTTTCSAGRRFLGFHRVVNSPRPASRASASRDEPVHHCCRRSACRTRSTVRGCCRSARSTILHRARLDAIEFTMPATKMLASWCGRRRPGCRWRRRARAPVDQDAADRDRAGRVASFEPAFVDELA